MIRIPAILSIVLLATVTNACAEWKIKPHRQLCVVDDPYTGNCTALSVVYNSATGVIFNCTANMHSGGPNRSPPSLRLACERWITPITGPIEVEPSARPNFIYGQTTRFGSQFSDWIDFYWVIGRDITDVRICYPPTKICSGPPTIR